MTLIRIMYPFNLVALLVTTTREEMLEMTKMKQWTRMKEVQRNRKTVDEGKTITSIMCVPIGTG
jgi:hypothetical protein